MARLLIIDDDPQMRRSLEITLTAAGHTVAAAANGRAGLKAFRDGAVDIVITDIVMPEMEGLETIRELRRRRPDLKIVAISGAWSQPISYLRIAKELGAHYLLAKPFETQALLDVIDRASAS
jgi:DNA-binding NtrC family response regulator